VLQSEGIESHVVDAASVRLKAQIIRELDRLEVPAGAVEDCRGGTGRFAQAGQ